MLPIAAFLVTEAAARQARSAMPDAPVLPHLEPPYRPPRRRLVRSSLAAGLYRAARVVEPAR